MTIAIIATLASAAYVTGFLVFTRWRYSRTRPFTEPLTCLGYLACERGDHRAWCYTRSESTVITSAMEALAYAALCGIVWPGTLLVLGAMALLRAAVRSTRELPEERAARIIRMERENGIGGR